MKPPTDQEVDALLSVLRKQDAYQKVDLYGEPVYARSIEVELFIVEDWKRMRQSFNASDVDGPVWSKDEMEASRKR